MVNMLYGVIVLELSIFFCVIYNHMTVTVIVMYNIMLSLILNPKIIINKNRNRNEKRNGR